mmetsp:Transcript_11960/g.30530  ORF Transcript_11960/g.30530 Transcript_11960/m.30530 type:complete len:108 (-) Transcript_11960:1321-1644(-)
MLHEASGQVEDDEEEGHLNGEKAQAGPTVYSPIHREKLQDRVTLDRSTYLLAGQNLAYAKVGWEAGVSDLYGHRKHAFLKIQANEFGWLAELAIAFGIKLPVFSKQR